MKKIMIISLIVFIIMSFQSCQDTLGIDDYKKRLVAADTTFIYLQDTVIIDSVITDTLIVEKIIKDTILINDTIWKEVYHSYFELIITDGYILNERMHDDLAFHYEKKSGRITYTNEMNKYTTFIDLDINNSYYDFNDYYIDRDEIITNFKIKLSGYEIKPFNTKVLNGNYGSDKYAEINKKSRTGGTFKYTGEENQMMLTTSSIQQNHLGEMMAATILFNGLVDTEHVLYDWMVLSGIIYMRF